MRERITRTMVERQFARFVKLYPAPEGWRLVLDHLPGVGYRVEFQREDGKGGSWDALTSGRQNARGMFDCLYFANGARDLCENLAEIAARDADRQRRLEAAR